MVDSGSHILLITRVLPLLPFQVRRSLQRLAVSGEAVSTEMVVFDQPLVVIANLSVFALESGMLELQKLVVLP